MAKKRIQKENPNNSVEKKEEIGEVSKKTLEFPVKFPFTHGTGDKTKDYKVGDIFEIDENNTKGIESLKQKGLI